MPTNRAGYCADGEQMPNWCMNEVSISGGKSDMEDFLAEFCEEDPSQKGRYRFVYDKISPMEEPEPPEPPPSPPVCSLPFGAAFHSHFPVLGFLT